jgi:hypothetical protein
MLLVDFKKEKIVFSKVVRGNASQSKCRDGGEKKKRLMCLKELNFSPMRIFARKKFLFTSSGTFLSK